MPAAGHLTVAWIEAVRLQLREQRDFRVAQLIESDRFGLEAGQEEQLEVYLALRVAAEAALRDVEAALRRIADGSYGLCTQCDASIERPRLEAVPSVPLCQACHQCHRAATPQRASGGSPDLRTSVTTSVRGLR